MKEGEVPLRVALADTHIIDTPAALADYARLKAAVEGRPAPISTSAPAVELVSEDEAEDAPVPLPPADESDDDAPPPPPLPPALLYGAGTDVLATDGKVQHPAKVVADCLAGAETCCIEWTTGRTGQHVWPVSAVVALEDLRPRRPVINKRSSPWRKGPAKKRARPVSPPPTLQLEESDDEVMQPPPLADDDAAPPPPSEGEEEEEEDAAREIVVKFAAAGITVTPPVATPRAAPLPEGDDDDDVPRRSQTSLLKRRAKPLSLTTPPLESDDDDDNVAPVSPLREEDAEAMSVTAEGPAATPLFSVGDEVEARWNYQKGGLTWFLGRVLYVHRDGSYSVSYEDGDQEVRVASSLIRTPFEVETLGDGYDLSEGERCFALFDDPEKHGGQDVWGGTILAAWRQRGGLSAGHKRFRVVFDDGSIHSPWAFEVARAVTPSIARSTLAIDRPGHKAQRLIARAPKQLRAAELGSGCGRLSYWLSRDGVWTWTVDFDPTVGADDQRDFLHLPLDYFVGNHIIHVSPDCFTYSRLAGSKHRTRDNPEGHSAAAARANRELEHLVAMCARAQEKDPNSLILFENPVGMMELTKAAREGLEQKLGLRKLEASYCKFVFGAGSPYVKKPTHFWTNCLLLIATFGDGKFSCSKHNCSCGDGYHRRVRPEAGQGDRARDFAAFPDELAKIIARILISDARSIYFR